MLEILASFIIQFIQNTGYLGIFVLMALESALIPIPSEVTMPFSGYLVSNGSLSLVLVIIVGTVANLVGSLLAYWLGWFLEETILLKWIRNYGKFILLSEHEYQVANKWFKKYGDKIVLISRLLPGVRTVISLPAGMFRMDLKKFIVYTTVGSLLWSALLTYVGVALGKNWNKLDPYYRKFELVIVVLLVIFALAYVERHLNLRKKFLKRG